MALFFILNVITEGGKSMKEVFTFMLYRNLVDAEGNIVKQIPATPEDYANYSFSDHYIFAMKNGFVDVFQKDLPFEVLYSKTPFITVLPLQKFHYVEVYKEKYFIVRIDTLWGAHNLQGKELIPVNRHSRFEVEEALKKLG